MGSTNTFKSGSFQYGTDGALDGVGKSPYTGSGRMDGTAPSNLPGSTKNPKAPATPGNWRG